MTDYTELVFHVKHFSIFSGAQIDKLAYFRTCPRSAVNAAGVTPAPLMVGYGMVAAAAVLMGLAAGGCLKRWGLMG